MLRRKGITARQELANRMLQVVDEAIPYVKNDIADKLIFRHTVAKVELPVKEPPSPPFYLTDDVKPSEFHVIRLGDIAIATNPFELFMDYGVLIKARSKAVFTLLVQLSCQHSGYQQLKGPLKEAGTVLINILLDLKADINWLMKQSSALMKCGASDLLT